MSLSLLLRIAREKRIVIGLVAIALVANIAVSALMIYPMYTQAQAGTQLAASATQAMREAEREFASANGIVAGKNKATDDLRQFYSKVLPTDVSAARRATYLQLAQMARDADLQTQRRGEEVLEPKKQEKDGSTLTRFSITMVLKGDYQGVRAFLRDIEASDTFVVIDNIGLAEGNEPNGPLVLTVELSTYFRTMNHGA